MIKSDNICFNFFNIDIDRSDSEIHKRIKDDLIKKVTVFDEKAAIRNM